MKIKTIITTLLCCLVFAAVARTTDLPRKNMNGKEYYVYKVIKGEGFYNIMQKFDISKEDIIKYNPSAKQGLKAGQVLFIPVENDTTPEAENQAESFEHTIKRGESLYSIAKMYGVTIDEICRLNPGSRKRINAGDKLLIPQKNTNKETASKEKKPKSVKNEKAESGSTSYIYHTITKGETLYAIARQYNSGVESIIRANPGIKPSKLARGAVIRVPVKVSNSEDTPSTSNDTLAQENEQEEVQNSATEKRYETYVAKKKETYYSIAQKFGVSIADLRAVNPTIRTLREGTVINLPDNITQQATSEAAPDRNANSTEYLEELYNRIYAKNDADHINVAIMLPFMLKEGNNVKSELYTEYYQGFLLAVDSLKRQGYSINLSVYDTEGSTSTVNKILQQPCMTEMDLIIAPDQEEAIDLIADFGEQHDINVVNTFSMKNERINTNARVFQTNIPTSYLYAETTARFVSIFKSRNIVLLTNSETETLEENEFIEMLKDELSEKKIVYTTCTYTGTLKPEDLTSVEQLSSVVFVPTSNKKETPSQILPALDNFARNTPDCEVSLFGYPSWVPQINRNLDEFYHLDTYIFTRFYTAPEDSRMYDFNLKYLYWYNKEMKNASPKYALLGFDTGMYFMNAIAQNGKNFANYDIKNNSSSIQTDFRFERINNWSGFINKSFYLIHMSPDRKLEKINL